MNSPSSTIATRTRATSLRRVKIILEKSNGLLLAHIARAWGTGNVSLANYGHQIYEGVSVQQHDEKDWIDSDTVDH